MSTTPLPPILQNPDLADAYQKTYDELNKAYWQASDVPSKDLIHGTMEAIGDIITALDEGQLANNTAGFLALQPKIKATNKALEDIKTGITAITKNISTATNVIAAVSKLLSLSSALV